MCFWRKTQLFHTDLLKRAQNRNCVSDQTCLIDEEDEGRSGASTPRLDATTPQTTPPLVDFERAIQCYNKHYPIGQETVAVAQGIFFKPEGNFKFTQFQSNYRSAFLFYPIISGIS